MITPYFAYGSNLEAQPMRERCPQALALRVAQLSEWAFCINERGYATVVPSAQKAVWGLLWQLTPADEAALDEYEAIAEGLYTKTWFQVWDSAGLPNEAMIYVATNPRPGRPRTGYLEGILLAAEQLGLPTDYQDELRDWLKLGIYGT